MCFKELPLPKDPKIPEFSINILDMGASLDGKTDVKPVLDAAMTACNEKGGGHIIASAESI